MKKIELTQGKFAVVSDCDYENLNKYKWHALKVKNNYVACRMEGLRPNRKRIYMHRQIMGFPHGMLVDHKDHNALNNTRNNLRVATYQQNRFNSKPVKNTSSKYLGVSYCKDRNAYRVQLSVNGKPTKFGSYKDEKTAALKYNEVAKMYYGEFANLNQITQ